jgi:hypothetical protein
MSLLAESPGAMQPEEVPPTRSLPRPQVVDYPHMIAARQFSTAARRLDTPALGSATP